MKKRTFLKNSATLMAGGMVAPLVSCNATTQQAQSVTLDAKRTNWAGNLTYQAANFYQPDTVSEIQKWVSTHDKVKVLGTQHCFNAIADSQYNQLSLRKLNRILAIDEEAQTATIQAGASYGQVCESLYQQGYALHNLASLPHISIAGACATATHGSGINNGNLASAVAALEFIDAKGELVSLSRTQNPEIFGGAVVHLGGLGVITQLTLDLVSAFDVKQDVYLDLPLAELESNFIAIMGSGYSVSLFTAYQTDTVNQVWIKTQVDSSEPSQSADPEFYGAQLAERNIHPLIELSAENCTEQMGIVGPWYDRLPHFKMEFTPSNGVELQTEYFVPIESAVEAYQAIQALATLIRPLLMISEIRTIAADNLWMSPCYKRQAVAFHFTWEQDWERLKSILPRIEEALAPFEVRPHWGKLFTIPPNQLRQSYPKLDDFTQFLAIHDPQGKFRNEFLDTYLYAQA